MPRVDERNVFQENNCVRRGESGKEISIVRKKRVARDGSEAELGFYSERDRQPLVGLEQRNNSSDLYCGS